MSNLTCTACGHTVRATAKFCPKCGQQMAGIVGQQLQAVSQQTPQVQQAQPQQPKPLVQPPQIKPAKKGIPYSILGGLLLTLILILGLAIVAILDTKSPQSEKAPSATSVQTVQPLIKINYLDNGLFGLQTIDGLNLMGRSNGESNSTYVSVDGKEASFGGTDGEFKEKPKQKNGVLSCTWEFENIRFTQNLSIVKGFATDKPDTLKIQYMMKNLDKQDVHQVGLRLMLDTKFGEHDGVPFIIEGKEILETSKEFKGDSVPKYIEAIEGTDLQNPGVSARFQFLARLPTGDNLRPDRIVISAWPGDDAKWEYFDELGGDGISLITEGQSPDTAVGIYYNPRDLAPKENREVILYYGLSEQPSVSKAFSLKAVPKVVSAGDSFFVDALISSIQEGRGEAKFLTLSLPEGLSLDTPNNLKKEISMPKKGQFVPVQWKIKTSRSKTEPGEKEITVKMTPYEPPMQESCIVDIRKSAQ